MRCVRIAAIALLALGAGGCLCVETTEFHARREAGSPVMRCELVFRRVESDAQVDSLRQKDFTQLLGAVEQPDAPDSAEAAGMVAEPSRPAVTVEGGALVVRVVRRYRDWARFGAAWSRDMGARFRAAGDTLVYDDEARRVSRSNGVTLRTDPGHARLSWRPGAERVDLVVRDPDFHAGAPADFVRRWRAHARQARGR